MTWLSLFGQSFLKISGLVSKDGST